ncbi:MAG: hypothetical protein PW788_02195 [Micavibrio sp.]|nr:hypothetical protein [Micavibrio sp.]
MTHLFKDFRKKFNRTARRIALTAATAISMTFSFNAAAAQLQQHPARQPMTSAFTMPAEAAVNGTTVGDANSAKPAPKTPYKYSDARLQLVEDHMRKTQLGQDLLKFAEDEKIAIRLSRGSAMDDNSADKITFSGLNFGDHILLNGDVSNDDAIMLTLAHELRHSWHKRIAKADALELEPKRQWIRDRIEEADAFSFEVHFGYEYEQATGKKLNLGNRANACAGDGYLCLVESYRGWRDGGMAAPDAYEKLLEKAFVHVHGLDYDSDFLKDQLDTYGDIVKRPAIGYLYSAEWSNPASEADYTDAMRRIVTVGINPASDRSAFAGWTPLDLQSLAKTGGEDDAGAEKLKASENKFAEARAAFDNYQAALTNKIQLDIKTPPLQISVPNAGTPPLDVPSTNVSPMVPVKLSPAPPVVPKQPGGA